MRPRLQLLFFLSGATGLTYESVWGRELHRVFGTSQFAIATVLAAFMTGLAVGGGVGARLAARVERPLRVYAGLELCIGLFALVFPAVMAALEPAYLQFYWAFSPGPVAFGVFQFVLLGIALLVPTACMGATLPILTRYVAPTADGAGKAVGRLYAINTFGAVFGTWAVGFYLLPDLGVRLTTLLAAAANLLLAYSAWRMDRAPAGTGSGSVAGDLGDLGAPVAAVAAPAVVPALAGPVVAHAIPLGPLFVAALAGFSSLALEVAWFRLLALILGASVYAFSVMLLAFLVGIASGGEAGGWLADRLVRRPALGLAGTQLAVAAMVWAATWAWPKLPTLFVGLYFVVEPEPALLWPMKCLVAMLVMTPAAFGMGATFPLLTRVARAAATDGASLARTVGVVYAANTVGALVGAFLAGFVLLPNLYVAGTVLLCVGANLVGALVAAWPERKAAGRALDVGLLAAAIAGIVTVRAPWEPMMMTSGVYKYVDNLDWPEDGSGLAGIEKQIWKKMIERYQLLWYREGLSSVVTVAQNSITGNVWLANNGKIDASTTTDMPTQVLVAHTPMLFMGDRARSELLIGLASGITLGAITLHPELTRIDVAEIEPSMPDAARFFTAYNHDALSDPRVRVLPNDGRNQILITPPGTYDVIVAEPSNPWLTGVSNLFTLEFFQMGKTRLAPGGIWSQWVQMYGMDSRDLRAIIRTFCEAFPHVLLFSTIRDADMVMIGSESDIQMTEALAQQLVHKNVGMESEMLQIGVSDGYDLLSHYLFDRDVAMKMSEGVPLNTDDNLLVEYSAPKNLHRETSTENFLMLLPLAATPLESVPDAAGLLRLAQAYDARDDDVRALIALKEAERREPGRADTLLLYTAYQDKLKSRLR